MCVRVSGDSPAGGADEGRIGEEGSVPNRHIRSGGQVQAMVVVVFDQGVCGPWSHFGKIILGGLRWGHRDRFPYQWGGTGVFVAR